MLLEELYLKGEQMWRSHLISTHNRVNQIVARASSTITIPPAEYRAYLQTLLRAVEMTNRNQWVVENREIVAEYNDSVTALTTAIEARLDGVIVDLRRIAEAGTDQDSFIHALEQASTDALRMLTHKHT